MSRLRLLSLAVLLIAPRAARAKKPDTAHQSELGQGMALFVNGDFRGAVAHFNEALAEAHGGAETARVHLLRAQCFVAMSDEPDARRAFEMALDQDPDTQLDPNQVPPETVDLLNRVRSGLHAELTLLGQGGAALLDGKSLGALPIHQSIAIGHHELEVLTADKSFDQHESILARPGDSVSLRFELPAGAATAPATTAPASGTPSATPSPPGVATPAAASDSSFHLPFDLFGQLGALGDPANRALGFEAGAGIGVGALAVSVTGLVGNSGGLTVRAGGRLPNLIGPVGVFANAELPMFFTSHYPVGLGLQGGVAARWWFLEPYLSVGGQHFFSVPSPQFPSNYFLVGGGLRAYLP